LRYFLQVKIGQNWSKSVKRSEALEGQRWAGNEFSARCCSRSQAKDFPAGIFHNIVIIRLFTNSVKSLTPEIGGGKILPMRERTVRIYSLAALLSAIGAPHSRQLISDKRKESSWG